jgi:Rrf2 family protein
MRLQKNTLLALYSVLEFASDPKRHIPAADIAAKYGVSSHHLAKVLADLARAGIVESVRGVGGGYRFSGNARRLTLMDIIQRFEDIAPRPAGASSTPVERALDTVLAEIDDNARATFGSITIATMLRLIERQAAAAAAAKTSVPPRARAG